MRKLFNILEGDLVYHQAIPSNMTYRSWLTFQDAPVILRIQGGIAEQIKVVILLSGELSANKPINSYINLRRKFRTPAIHRALIFRLLKRRPDLMDHVEQDFQIQREGLFRDCSTETLWRILFAILSNQRLSPIYCILDSGHAANKNTVVDDPPLAGPARDFQKRYPHIKFRLVVDLPKRWILSFRGLFSSISVGKSKGPPNDVALKNGLPRAHSSGFEIRLKYNRSQTIGYRKCGDNN